MASATKNKKTVPKKTRKPAKRTKKANKKGEASKRTVARAAKKAEEAAQKEVPSSVVFTDEEMAPIREQDRELVNIRLRLSRVMETYKKQETELLGQLSTKGKIFEELTDKTVREKIGDAIDEYKWNLDFATNTLSREV